MKGVNGPFLRTERSAPVDYATFNRVTKETSCCYSRQEDVDQIKPSVRSYPFDPYTQARPDLYTFKRDSTQPKFFFTQKRADSPEVGMMANSGLVVATPTHDTAFVQAILWHVQVCGNLDFKLIGFDTMKPPVCEGYCKQTDSGPPEGGMLGKLVWVAEIVKLHGKDITDAQPDLEVFNTALYQALSTGIAFGMFHNDRKFADLYPMLGTMEPLAQTGVDVKVGGAHRRGPAATGSASVEPVTPLAGVNPLARSKPQKGATLQPRSAAVSAPPAPRASNPRYMDSSAGIAKWLVTRPTDSNLLVRHEQNFVLSRDFEMSVTHKTPNEQGRAVGAIFPLRRGVHVLRDGATVDRISISEFPVKYRDHPDAKGISRYEARLFSSKYAAGKQPMATLSVAPVAMMDPSGKLQLRYHVTKPKKDTHWNIPGQSAQMISDSDVEYALTQAPGWDPRLHASIETAMYKLRTGLAKVTPVDFD